VSAVLVLVTGPPGTGKSTIAETAAGALGASVFAWDWVMAGMTDFDDIQTALGAMDRERYRRVGWSILENLAVAQVRGGRSAVLDGVARQGEVDSVRRVARDAGVPSIVVATRCSDRALHRSRIDGRRRDIPGWHELEWSHVASVLDAWTEPTDVDLALDAADELDENLQRLRVALRRYGAERGADD
jgi:predicted kinase